MIQRGQHFAIATAVMISLRKYRQTSSLNGMEMERGEHIGEKKLVGTRE
jgi:hypothetical protein